MRPGKQQYPQQREQQYRQNNHRHDIPRINPHRVRADRQLRLRRLNAMPAHQQPVRVDTIRRAGHKRAVIFVGINCEVTQFIRQNNSDLVDLVGERPAQNLQLERIALLQLVDAEPAAGTYRPPAAGRCP